LTLRRNYPYRGVSDALVTHLRRRYGGRGYVGMELELNQKHVGSAGWRALLAVLGATLVTAVERV
ncbi:MAG TPA: N-formylglutamate amidohydrolase, partial [Gammaproteobacteria bacterium]|nr:N-formylglutamate amidohydrolase [Gammaproteobacteria bacterium]